MMKHVVVIVVVQLKLSAVQAFVVILDIIVLMVLAQIVRELYAVIAVVIQTNIAIIRL
jgi:hypothetical protein